MRYELIIYWSKADESLGNDGLNPRVQNHG